MSRETKINPEHDFPGINLPDELLPCPFCGADPFIMYWHGGGSQKRMVQCENESCDVHPGVTGKTRRGAIAAWNQRVPRDQKRENTTQKLIAKHKAAMEALAKIKWP